MKKTWIGFLVAAICVGCSGSSDNTGSSTGTTGSTTATTGTGDTTSTGTTATTTGSSTMTGTTSSAQSGEGGGTMVAYSDIQAAFDKNCVGCHGENGKGRIDLRNYQALMNSGEEGPIVKAGDPENSILVQALRGSHGRKAMPMKAPPLPEETIQKVEAWIKNGAKNE